MHVVCLLIVKVTVSGISCKAYNFQGEGMKQLSDNHAVL